MKNKLKADAAKLYAEHKRQIYGHTDNLFACLMIFQWLAGIAAAVWVSPKTWAGEYSQVHFHVYVAVILGGLLNLPSAALGFFRAGAGSTRYIIAVTQMLASALLIHLTGGRIETHFHIFGSLAFLAFYRDWKVLVPATVVVAADHWFRGAYWPQSVYGVLAASPWRWMEHAGWVVFEDIILVASCLRSTSEMKKIAERTAELQTTNQIIEAKVKERTQDLLAANCELEKEIKQRRKLEGIMVQSEKMAAIGQLAGGVAHEINNPLGVILGFSQNVVKRIQPGDPLEMPLKSIEREAFRCKNLVQDLLTFSRVEKQEKSSMRMKEVMEGALSLVLAQSKIKRIEVVKEIDEVPQVMGNQTQVQQVVVNLSTNAMDAMPDGGTLTVGLHCAKVDDRDGIEIFVRDTGHGIDESIQAKIYNPFFTTKEIGKGTGLGLSLVYEIVQKHAGKIWYESAVGKGTTFHVFFPIA